MLNSVILMGRLVADPELKTTSSGISVTSFAVAVDRGYARQGEDRQTDFINIVAWRQQADFVTKYFRKGQMIAIQGSLQSRSYDTKDGRRVTVWEVIADRISFCGSKNESGGGYNAGSASSVRNDAGSTAPAAFQNGGSEDFDSLSDSEDDLPF